VGQARPYKRPTSSELRQVSRAVNENKELLRLAEEAQKAKVKYETFVQQTKNVLNVSRFDCFAALSAAKVLNKLLKYVEDPRCVYQVEACQEYFGPQWELAFAWLVGRRLAAWRASH